jgi:hypothetical protein
VLIMASKWHDTRKARMDELFAGKKFEVVEEVDSDTPIATPLGYKVNKGYRLRSTDGTMDIVVGKSLLNTLADDYDAVEKPAPKKRGRPRKQPLEQAEEWAGREMPGDASPVTQPGPTMVNPNEDEHYEG